MQSLISAVGGDIALAIITVILAIVSFLIGKDHGKSKERAKQAQKELKDREIIDETIDDIRGDRDKPTVDELRDDERNRNRKRQ